MSDIIVVPVNFGVNSANAARYAANLALVTGAEIRLVHVVQPPSSFARHPTPDFFFREMRTAGYVLLNNLRKELSEGTGGKVRIYIGLETGDIQQQLKAFCERCKPFLVVMGAAESAPGEVFGSGDAIGAIKLLSHPLLVVPKNASFHGAPQVVIACDQEDIHKGMPSVLPFLKELHELLGTRYEVVHIVADGESFEDSLMEYERWKKQAEGIGPRLHLIRQSSVADGLNDYLAQHPADWLLVFPKKHSLLEFHKSEAKGIVLHCPVPALWLHE